MSQNRKRGRRSQRGQSIVETAIVMPLFVFLVLGIIQLSLMHQARSVTKYGAFRAARAGSMNHAPIETMERAAWDVLEPLVRTQNNAGHRHAEVVVCSPTRGVAQAAKNKQRGNNPNLAFDEPRAPGDEFEARKLAVQLTFYYPLFIPFADRVIFLISQAQENADSVMFKESLRMGTDAGGRQQPQVTQSRMMQVQAMSTRFVVPIRANYALRLQSDVPVNDGRLRDSNECVQL